MATYNGENYIEKQLNSILNQTHRDWQLYVRDDQSTDNTIDVLNSFVEKDSRIKIIQDDLGNLRSTQNFNILMEFCQDFGDYFMFSDQDDIWLDNKIEISLREIKKIENNKPSLVCCAQTLIDEEDNIINNNNEAYCPKLSLNILMTMNYNYGCTMIINKQLLKRCISIPRSAENHDYWISLIAVISKANYIFLTEKLMLYRQHNNNVSGNYQNSSLKNRWSRIKKNEEIYAIRSKIKMLADVVSRSDKFISQADRELIENYIKIVPKGGIKALSFVIRNEIKKINRLSTLIYYFSILKG